ncbi:MAG: hypothetical protein U1D30_01460 [Planctomycetota bacterium]
MKPLARLSLVLLLVPLTGGGFAAAQAPAVPSDMISSRERSFRIPFRVDPVERMRLSEIQLHISMDRGQSWRHYASGQPEQEYFTFTARNDGEYWFTVRTVDREGRQYPPTLAGVAPGLRVLVDTTPPEVTLRGLNPVGEKVGIEWEILDDNLDPRSVRVEFRGPASGDWFSVPVQSAASGREMWSPGMQGPLQIRLRVLDKAGNEGMKEITLGAPTGIPPANQGYTPAGNNAGSWPNATNPGMAGMANVGRAPLAPLDGAHPPVIAESSPKFLSHGGTQNWENRAPNQARSGQGIASRPRTPLNVQLVNSTRFQINYSADEVGKSGLGSIALWYTLDGIHWEFYGEDEDRESPFLVEVNGEGQYGFILVARSGAGVGDDPPAQGDPAQITIEVDITPPEIRLDPPETGVGATAGILNITWNVQDANLDPRSIGLYYAENASGPWQPIAKDLENTGRYQWRFPREVPFKFHVRLEAKDRAGNLGRAETVRPVIVDLIKPRLRILKVEPNGPTNIRPTTTNKESEEEELPKL